MIFYRLELANNKKDIKVLKNNLYKLENPFKYEVGQDLYCIYFNRTNFKCKIVNVRWNEEGYLDKRYLVYIEKLKYAEWVSEGCLSKNKVIFTN